MIVNSTKTMAADRSQQLEWRTVAEYFKPDAALRDIYVNNTSLADWQATLDRIRERYAPLKFKIDGQPADLPPQVADIFRIRERAAPC